MTACTTNSTDATVPASATTQCIAGFDTSTRRSLGNRAGTATSCILDPQALVPGAVYQTDDCLPGALNAEPLAEARVIAQLNQAGVYGDTSATGITPNVQWETVVPGTASRPDLLLYNRNDPTQKVGLVEMKGTWSSDDPVQEVSDYVSQWNAAGGQQAEPYHFATPVDDNFEIQLGGPCKYDPSVTAAYLYHTYSDPANDGVIWVDRTKRECPKAPDPVSPPVVVIPYQGTIGQDANGNGQDDFWDYIDEHPELWDLDSPIPDVPFVPLSTPVYVEMDQSTLLEVEEAMADAGPDGIDAAWASLVDSMPELVADCASYIAAGDAAALGLDSAEMAVAVTAAEAGFITVGAALIIPVIAVVLVAIIWAIMHWHLFGDPHFSTIDGLAYTMQAEGEFHAVEVPSLGLDVQARLMPSQGDTTISYVSALSVDVNNNLVELDPDGTDLVNGVAIPSTQTLTEFGDGMALARNDGDSVITFGEDDAALAFGGDSIGFDIDPGIPTKGLLGNNDGVPDNDLTYADGTPLASSDAATLDGPFADSWRIGDDESFFTYPDGADTSTYTDESFPSNVVSLSDFAQSDLDIARQDCVSNGVTSGPALDGCMLDVAETGDADYATAAAAQNYYTIDPSDATVDSAGVVSQDFADPVATNFMPDSVETLGASTAAGPIFDGSGYSFTVPDIPGHDSATVSLDLYAIGITAANEQSQSVTVDFGDPDTTSVIAFTPTSASVSSGPATVTAVAQGTTAGGAAYQEYLVTMTTPQYDPELKVGFSPSGFRGIIGTSVAVDDITASVHLVPAQTFTASLPLSASSGTLDGAAATGAGDLEDIGSADVYSFTVPAGGTHLGVNLASCPADVGSDSLGWTLASSTGATVSSGGCGGKNTNLVPAGTYTLTVAGGGVTGAYQLSVESPQVFAATLPLAVTANTVDGATASGAGDFEDSAAQDAYTFTVPAGGEDLALSLGSCPAQGYYFSSATWELIDAADQSVVDSGGCDYTDLGTVSAGSYELLTSAAGVSGTYTLNVESPHTFAVTTPLAITANTVNGASTPGAGDFATGASRDIYTFTVPAGGETLDVDFSGCPTQNYSMPLQWQLTTAGGIPEGNGYCGYSELDNLPAGSYQMAVAAGGVPGTYALNLEEPQTFAVTVPLTVTADTANGTATPGAGRFETTASQDVYDFTVPAGGQSLVLNVASCPTQDYSTPLSWTLYDSAGTEVDYGYCGYVSLGDLPADSYHLDVDAKGMAGTYAMNLDVSQTFAVTTPLVVTANTVNGAAATGAGDFEDVASQDIYAFTVPSGGQTMSVNVASCPKESDGITDLEWRLYDSAGTEVDNGYCGFTALGSLVGGNYQLELDAGGLAGTYALNLDTAQTFSVTTPLAVTANTVNGTTTTGAGDFEDVASEDIYSFTVPSGGQALSINVSSCPKDSTGFSDLEWRLYNGTGTEVDSGYCGFTALGTLAADTYQLRFYAYGDAGTYAFNLEGPQTFAVTIPLTVTANTVNGAAATGAGDFETGASQDIYTFTVPSGGQQLSLNLSGCPTQSGITEASWGLLNGSGGSVDSGYCGYHSLGTLPAGTYSLVVDSGGVAGTYTLNVALAQTYSVTLPLAVTANTINGTSTPGAGDFSTTASQQSYTFTVPTGGQEVDLNLAACPTQSGITDATWTLFDGSGNRIDSGYCEYSPLGTLAAGGYALVVSAGGVAGTYALNMEAAQTFPVTVPLKVTSGSINGTATAGAGDFETTASKDDYTLTVPTGGQALGIDVSTCPKASNGLTDLEWFLDNSSGSEVDSGYCGYSSLGTVAAGSYVLKFEAEGVAGTYAFNLDVAQSFAVTVPLKVTGNSVNGTTTTGAGDFEDGASQDIYTFTVPSGGQTLSVDVSSCPKDSNGLTDLNWYLDTGSGSEVDSGYCGYSSLGTVAAGSYVLKFEAEGVAGTYAFNLDVAQSFAVTVPLKVTGNTVNGTATTGAGDFEDTASEDIYTFTVPSGGQTLNIDVGSCPTSGGIDDLEWRLYNSSNSEVDSGYCGYFGLGALAAGSYALRFYAYGLAGTYTINLEAPQTFTVTTPLTVSANTVNGTATTGAGDFEDAASQDIYTFTVPSGGKSFTVTLGSCPASGSVTDAEWKIVNSSGSTVTNGYCGSGTSTGTLAAGTYQLVVISEGLPGTYALTMK
ncbi:MAG TPA: VWD domain-containing protein [Actinocrinis sp.]